MNVSGLPVSGNGTNTEGEIRELLTEARAVAVGLSGNADAANAASTIFYLLAAVDDRITLLFREEATAFNRGFQVGEKNGRHDGRDEGAEMALTKMEQLLGRTHRKEA